MTSLALILTSLVLTQAPVCTAQGDCERLCADGTPAACGRAGAAAMRDDPFRAAGLLQRGCDDQDTESCGLLAVLYSEGRGAQADAARATTLTEFACKRGYGPSCLRLAQAAESRAARQGNPEAVRELSLAANHLYTACESSLAEACASLARLYFWGAGVRVDPLGAGVVAARACSLGDRNGCRLLAAFHAIGLGGPKDPKQSLEIQRKAGPAERAKLLLVPPIKPGDSAVARIDGPSAGSLVLVDSMLAGTAPLSIELPVGEHVIEFVEEGKPPLRDQLVVRSGSPNALRFARSPTLSVTSQPSGAEVLLDGVPVGATPGQFRLAPGVHQLKIQAAGYQAATTDLTIVEDSDVTRRFELVSDTTRISVSSAPPGATLRVDGREVGTTPWSGEVSTGTHTLEFEKQGFHAFATAFDTVSSTAVSVTLKLRPETLQITSEPPGATVQLDLIAVGQTPWSGRLLPGRHTVSIQLDGYKTVTRSFVSAERPAPIAVVLDADLVSTTLISKPPGALVTLDGTPVGVTPWTGSVRSGAHVVELRLAGFRTLVETIRIEGTRPGALKFGLEPRPPGLVVTTRPAGAEVVVDGRKVGVSPLEQSMPPGRYQLMVTLAGHEAVSIPVEVMTGVTEQVIELAPLPISVAIETVPPGAKVYVDAVERGTTPFMVALPPGSHRLYAVKESFEPADVTKTLESGPGTTWRVVLVPTQRPRAEPIVAEVPPTPPLSVAVTPAPMPRSTRRTPLGVAPAPVAGPPVPLVEPKPPENVVGAHLGGKAGVGALIPVRSLDEAKTDPRFSAAGLVDVARVKVISLTDKFPYYGIATNGCGLGKSFVMSELISPFDGLPAGLPVVLRIEDPTIGPARAGSTLAFSGLRRAGKAPDGTFVYCGKGSAFPVRP